MDQGLRAQFYQAVKLYSFIRNERERRARERDARGQEKSFKKNFWAFSKKVVNGLLGKEAGKPTFSRDFANDWYKEKYSTPVPFSEQAVSWFPRLPVPEREFGAN